MRDALCTQLLQNACKCIVHDLEMRHDYTRDVSLILNKDNYGNEAVIYSNITHHR